jgi:hypothetical protein
MINSLTGGSLKIWLQMAIFFLFNKSGSLVEQSSLVFFQQSGQIVEELFQAIRYTHNKIKKKCYKKYVVMI